MRVFEVDRTDERIVIRFILGMGIKNDELRRIWILITLLPMLAFNILQVVVFGIPFFLFLVLRALSEINTGLWDTTIVRWNTPRPPDPTEDEQDNPPCPNCGGTKTILTASHSGRQGNGVDADVDCYRCTLCGEEWSE